MKKKILFIVNPKAGGISKVNIRERILNELNTDFFDAEICIPESIIQTKQLLKKEIFPDAIVAVGGDGTINLIAKYLVNKSVPLGIIPMGSGDGLARSIKIPLDFSKAMGIINDFNIEKIDTGSANDMAFFNILGLGFDAHIAGLFERSTKRGLWNYARLSISEFFRYKPQPYRILSDKLNLNINAFMISVCLGNQFGNNFFVAPDSNIRDGLFSVTIIRRVHFFNVWKLLWKIKKGTLSDSSDVIRFNSNQLIVKREKPGLLNIDGEPITSSDEVTFHIFPESLKIICPRNSLAGNM